MLARGIPRLRSLSVFLVIFLSFFPLTVAALPQRHIPNKKGNPEGRNSHNNQSSFVMSRFYTAYNIQHHKLFAVRIIPFNKQTTSGLHRQTRVSVSTSAPPLLPKSHLIVSSFIVCPMSKVKGKGCFC